MPGVVTSVCHALGSESPQRTPNAFHRTAGPLAGSLLCALALCRSRETFAEISADLEVFKFKLQCSGWVGSEWSPVGVHERLPVKHAEVTPAVTRWLQALPQMTSTSSVRCLSCQKCENGRNWGPIIKEMYSFTFLFETEEDLSSLPCARAAQRKVNLHHV